MTEAQRAATLGLMPFPSTLTLVTVSGAFDVPPSGGATGTVDFIADKPLQGSTIVPPFTRQATLASDGTFAIELPATNDPQWIPVNWAYRVVATVAGAVFSGTLQLDYQTTSVTLATLFQPSGAVVTGTTYLLLSQRSVAGGVAGLDADGDVIDAGGNKVGEAAGGGISETIVNAKGDLIAGTANDAVARVAVGSNGQYLVANSGAAAGVSWDTVTASDVSGLGGAATLDVGTSSGTVAAGDDSRITGALQRATGGTVTADVTVADNATATKAYRFKVSGGSLDLDAAGSDLYLSAYPIADFTGTQRAYARYESGAQLAHLLGRHLIAAGAFDSTGVADLDPATGVAAIGAKNSLANARFCGFKATAGAPSTGTWATADIVLDSAGSWHLCTAGGTPGTWVSPVATHEAASDPHPQYAVMYYSTGSGYTAVNGAATYVGPDDPGAVANGSIWIDTDA